VDRENSGINATFDLKPLTANQIGIERNGKMVGYINERYKM